MDTVKIIMEILSALSIIVASLVAIYGINAWKREFQGKRQIELAEDVLALFYEARDTIGAVRNPFGFQGEGSTRKPENNETPEQKNARDRAYSVYERLQKHNVIFSKLHSMRYQFMARFGKESGKPFDDIRKIVIEITVSADMLAELWCERSYSEEKEKLANEIKEYTSIIWHSGTKDTIVPRVERIISDIENICRPIILEQVSVLHIPRHFLAKIKKWWSD